MSASAMTVAHSARTSPLRIVVLLSGRGSNFRAILDHIENRQLAAVFPLVVSDRRDASGLQLARDKGIPTALVERRAKERDNEDFAQELAFTVKQAEPDLIVLAGFMRVLGSKFVSAFSGRIVNIHPSLLPSFRGLNAQAQAIAAGVKFAGCTVHLVEEEVDGGPILAQAVVPVFPNDTVEQLSARILECEHRLFPAVIERFVRGEISVGLSADKRLTVVQHGSASAASDRLLSLDTHYQGALK